MSKVTALCPWFGSNRTLAKHVGALLAGRPWVGVPFAGGMSEVRHLTARTILVSDLHRHLINLAKVAQDEGLNHLLRQRLSELPYHPDTLEAAQRSCRQREEGTHTEKDCPLWWACDYFVCAWMARNGKAGTRGEFGASLSVRYDGGGGDSLTRFRNATEALAEWRETFKRCQFVCEDVFDFVAKVRDREDCGLYLDPPFPGPGDEYKHRFTEEQHRELAKRLGAYEVTKVVCRFYRHPLVEELYPAPKWTWIDLAGGRTQTNGTPPEVLLVNGPVEPEPKESDRG
jgi:DNA adenine methylase